MPASGSRQPKADGTPPLPYRRGKPRLPRRGASLAPQIRVLPEPKKRATTGRPYTNKANRSQKMSAFTSKLYDTSDTSVHRPHPDFVGATSGRPLFISCTDKTKAQRRFTRGDAREQVGHVRKTLVFRRATIGRPYTNKANRSQKRAYLRVNCMLLLCTDLTLIL